MKNDFYYISSYDDIPSSLKTELLSNIKSSSDVRTSSKKTEVDISWISKVEEALPFINNYLKKHEIDFDNTYENRFIYTLIVNIQTLIKMYGNDAIKGNGISTSKSLTYSATTNTYNEKIDINISIDTKEINSFDELKNGITIPERVNKLKSEVSSLTSSSFFKALQKKHVMLLNGEVDETYLTDKDLQVCKKLWDFILEYKDDSRKEERIDKVYDNDPELNRALNSSGLFDYYLLSSIINNEEKKYSTDDINLDSLRIVIKNYIDSNPNMKELKFLGLVKSEFKNIRNDQLKKYDLIRKKMDISMNKYANNKRNALDIIK